MPKVESEIFVISDLHVGGEYGDGDRPADRGFRICTRVDALRAFIERLAARPSSPRTELVINGDFVDFLAERWEEEPHWRPFVEDAEAAAARLERVIARDRPLFDALGAFLTRGHALTILLGNHDLELSLPKVRRVLLDALGDEPRRLRFLYDNEAYVLGDLIIEHGNRYDGFNRVDHDALRRLRSAQSRRLPLRREQGLEANAGSRLVAEVMNDIKRDYPFVDLLKPETGATIPILLALAPRYRRHLAKVARLGADAALHAPRAPAEPRYGSDIASRSERRERAPDDEEVLRALLVEQLGEEATGRLVGSDGYGSDISSGGRSKQAWGLLKLIAADEGEAVEARLPALLDALGALQSDRTFDLQGPIEAPYEEAAKELIDRGFAAVVFGHTHQARELRLRGKAREGIYLNTGCWADLMRFPQQILSAPDRSAALAELRGFVEALQGGDIRPYVHFDPTYARVSLGPGGEVLDAKIERFEP